jgi:O-antigen/teichoic acid export membrane protein
VSIGAIAMIGKNQGAAMIVNAFFNTVMNTAMGIANSISTYIVMFSQNVTQPMLPQITKSYAANDMKRTDELLLMSTKYAFFLMFFASSPFLVQPEWLLNIWLGQVPPYAKTFLVLLIIDNLVLSLNGGISNVIFASGKIKLYQIITSTLNILSVIFGFIALYFGLPAYVLIYVYIIMSVLRVIAVQIILKVTLDYNNKYILLNSYLPSLFVVLSFIPLLILKINVHPLLSILLSMVYLACSIIFIGLKRNERTLIISKVMNYIKNKC